MKFIEKYNNYEEHPGPGRYNVCKDNSLLKKNQQNSQSVFASTTTRNFMHNDSIRLI